MTSATNMVPIVSDALRQAAQRGEWPSGPASSISLTEVKHSSVRSETGWATFQMNDQNSSPCRPSEGTLN